MWGHYVTLVKCMGQVVQDLVHQQCQLECLECTNIMKSPDEHHLLNNFPWAEC